MEEDKNNQNSGGDVDYSASDNNDYVVEEKPAKVKKSGGLSSAVTKVKAISPITALFGLIVVIAIMVIVFITLADQQEAPEFESTELTEEERQALDADQSEIETTGQVLTIGPNTEFSNDVRVEKSLEVIGDLSVAGEINIPELDIGGSELTLDSAQIDENLLVSGNSTVQGGLTVNGGASVNGTLSAGGISTGNLSLSGDLTITRHIRADASSASLSSGGALGNGGTASVSGDDVSGTININTGSSAPAGRLATVNFQIAYGSTPQVIITPVGSDAAAVDYYTQRSSSGFSVYSRGNTPDNATIQFDYFVIE